MTGRSAGVALLLVALAFPLAAHGQSPTRWSCQRILHRAMGFAPADVPRFSSRNPLSIALASRLYYLRDYFPVDIADLPEPAREICLRESDALQTDLVAFFRRRFEHLLGPLDLAGFYTEYGNLLAPATNRFERESIRDLFPDTEGRYLQAVRSTLLLSLAGTPWERYSELRFEIHTMDQEWTRVLRREAPAAVNLSTHEVALRPLDYSPIELRIFLFHEISHLADPEHRRLPFENELYAWNQTREYLEHMIRQGENLPLLFERVHSSMRMLGLENWVRLVFQSRQPK